MALSEVHLQAKQERVRGGGDSEVEKSVGVHVGNFELNL